MNRIRSTEATEGRHDGLDRIAIQIQALLHLSLIIILESSRSDSLRVSFAESIHRKLQLCGRRQRLYKNQYSPPHTSDMTSQFPTFPAPDEDTKHRHNTFQPVTPSPLNPHTQIIHQSTWQLVPLAQRPPPHNLGHEIVDSLIAPKDVLQHQRPEKRTHSKWYTDRDANMDKRHPSSFQQLEKVRP